MKKRFIFLLSFFAIFFCSCKKTRSLDELLGEEFGFYITKNLTNIALTFLYNIDSEWQTPNSFCYSKILSYEKIKDRLLLTVEYSNRIIRGDPKICYYDWRYPLKSTVVLTPEIIEKMIAAEKSYKPYQYFVSDEEQSPSTCNALVITDNLRIRAEPNLDSTTEIIGKLKKWDDIQLVDCTKEKTKIDNLEYPWYKVHLSDGKEGWVFGGFAKIYFLEKDKTAIIKAFEQDGSEYTNQFVTPEGFY